MKENKSGKGSSHFCLREVVGRVHSKGGKDEKDCVTLNYQSKLMKV